VVVPAYNEQDSIAELVTEIVAAFATRPEIAFSIIFVDDGSTDGTWDALVAARESNPKVRGIRLRRNFGKASALAVGADAATGPIIVTMDADLQDDPAEIPRFLDALAAGPDLVSGWKRDRKDPLSKRLPSRLFNRITSMASGVKLQDHNCGFKAGRREIYTQIPLYGELHRYIPAMAHGLGYEVAEMEVHHRPRTHGHSKFGFERYLRGFLDLFTVLLITRYGRRPGHFFGGIGVIAALVGFLILTYLTGVWLFTDHPIGNRPLLTLGVLLEVVAVQLIAVGILAELILHRTTPRPASHDLVIDDLEERRAS
jgi:glycosyltransferase involved in cell wall biosynthesis